MKKPAIFLLSLVGAISADAATLVSYTFTAPNPSSPTAPVAGIAASNITATDFQPSTTSGSAFLRGNASVDTLAGAITDGDYIQFSISVTGANILNLDSFTFDHTKSGTFTSSNLSVFASLNGFATTPTAGNSLFDSTATGTGKSFSLTQFQGLTNATVTFRVYAFDNTDISTDVTRIDNIVIAGSIPEPASVLLSALGLGGLAFSRRRRA